MTATRRTTLTQLSLFALGTLACGQVAATLLAADILFRRHAAFDLAWAVGIPALLAVPCYVLGFRSLRIEDRQAPWLFRVFASFVAAAILLYLSMFAILNIYGS